jgi:hypothetical protein
MKKRRRHPPTQSPYAGVRKGDTAELARRLAPPEERQQQPPQDQPPPQVAALEGTRRGGGTIVVEAAAPQRAAASGGAAAAGKKAWRPFGVEPVVLVIVALMLLFVAFIAWHVSTLEEEGPQPVRIVGPEDRSR